MPAAPDLELIRGTLDLLLLKTLSWGPMHGLAALQWIERTTNQKLQVEEGALYPALHRLELRGLLDAEWGVSENKRRAKFYRLNAAGRKYLVDEASSWDRLSAAVARVMQTA